MNDGGAGKPPTQRFSSLVRASRVYFRAANPISYLARRFIAVAARAVATECCIAVDLGCGTSPYRRQIIRAFATGMYVGIDSTVTDTTQIAADVRHLPIADATVDLAVSFDVIQHVPESHLMLDEIARVLRLDGHVLLTYPFLYAECDVHDFQRWTLEGMNHALMKRGLSPIISARRGGPIFTAASAITWAAQHFLPGQRRSWHAERSVTSVLRGILLVFLTLPAFALGWIALALDAVLPTRGIYMGGAVLARKGRSHQPCDG